MPPHALLPDQLHTPCPAEALHFRTTADLEPVELTLGQERAISAIRLAMAIPDEGYNLYVAGSSGLGRNDLVREVIARHLAPDSEIADWCYINNFETPHKPRCLKLPRGMASQLKADMEKLVERLLVTVPASFQSDDYRRRINDMREEYQRREDELFEKLGERARALNLHLVRTPRGYTIGPMREGKLLSAQEFNALGQEEQKTIQANIEILNKEVRSQIEVISDWQAEGYERVRELNNAFVHQAIDPVMSRLKTAWQEQADVIAYLNAVHEDVVENADDFLPEDGTPEGPPSRKQVLSPQFMRYQVNVLVDNSAQESVPILYEDNPTFQNLLGRVEHVVEMGALETNFTLIKPGALHRANGGYLVLDAYKVLMHGFSWEALKRVISAQEIRIESIEQVLSLATTTSLEPEPIPASIKVVLCGDRFLYYLLKEHDPDFSLLFKVHADFSESLQRTPEALALYARIIGTLARRHGVHALSADAVARVIEHSARSIEHGERLSLHVESIADLIRESDYQARQAGETTITRAHVQVAIDQWRHRHSRYQELLQREISENTLMISTAGTVAGQVNGLSVYQLGDFSFGRATRITATARLGSGKVLDIERESDLGGDIHSKGVMILSALLAHRYARDMPLALSATLVFEQSYGMIDGDSASVAELLALLSAITGLPLKQSLAVTGSINQRGEVQAIGGVNEKIEGFFDLCVARGLDGSHGVAIPAANVRHLMLREDVVEACRNGFFAVYPLTTVDDAIALFSGMDAGAAAADGSFPAGSFNRCVAEALQAFDQRRREANRHDDDRDNGRDKS